MIEITLRIKGMMCEHCEQTIDNAMKSAFGPQVKLSTSDHETDTTTILATEDIPDERLWAVVDQEGFSVQEVTRKEVEEQEGGLFGFLG